MKNLILIGTLVLVLITVQFAQAQTLSVDDIVNKHITAMGGKEKLQNLKSFRMLGTMNTQGAEVSLSVTRQHMTGSRTEFSVMGTENYQVVTPQKGWVYMPIRGQSAPEAMPDEQYKMAVNTLDLQGGFLDYKEKGNKVELVGKEKLDNADVYNMKVTFKNGFVMNYYIDATTFRINKNSFKVSMNGQEMDAGSTFSNYKQDANGYWFAYTSVNAQGETEYSSIETNIKIDENIFKAN